MWIFLLFVSLTLLYIATLLMALVIVKLLGLLKWQNEINIEVASIMKEIITIVGKK
jgi:hypothetical protein